MAIGLMGLLGGAAVTGAVGVPLVDHMLKPNYRDPDRMLPPTGYAANQSQMLQELLRRYNAGEVDLPPEQVEQLSRAAANAGMKFEVESKPFRKFMFDAADTLTLGLVPDEWRPYSIGQDLHGETRADRYAGGIGTIGGGFLGGGLLLKGGKMALGGLKGWLSKGSAAQAANRANTNAVAVSTKGMPSNVSNQFTQAGPYTPNQWTQAGNIPNQFTPAPTGGAQFPLSSSLTPVNRGFSGNLTPANRGFTGTRLGQNVPLTTPNYSQVTNQYFPSLGSPVLVGSRLDRLTDPAVLRAIKDRTMGGGLLSMPLWSGYKA